MGKKILLIDESAMLRRIAASVLGAQRAHFEVLAATRATEGFARACSSVPDLILADQRLSDVHGDDLSARLLSDPRTARVPIVLLTGRGVSPPAWDSLSANIVEVLGKPFAPEQLVAAVNAIIELSQGGASFPEIRARLHAPVRPSAADPPVRAAVQEVAPSWSFKPSFPAVTRPPAKPANDPALRFAFQRNASIASPRAALLEVAAGQLTGVLRFRPPGVQPVELYFETGRLLAVTTRDGLAYSDGAAEVLPAKVSPATLEAAVHEQNRSGTPFILTLGVRGLLSKSAAEALLQRFGQRCFARLWKVKPAFLAYEFEKLALPNFLLRLEPPPETPDEWLLGTVRQLDISDIVGNARHEGLVGTPTPRPGGEEFLRSLPLTPDERNFAAHVNGRVDLPHLGRMLGLTSETAYLMLYRFRCLEAMEYRPAPAAFVVTPRAGRRRVLPLKR